MIIVLEQLAGLGIRKKAIRMLAWIGTSCIAAVLALASLAAAMVPYALLAAFAVWRLTEPR